MVRWRRKLAIIAIHNFNFFYGQLKHTLRITHCTICTIMHTLYVCSSISMCVCIYCSWYLLLVSLHRPSARHIHIYNLCTLYNTYTYSTYVLHICIVIWVGTGYYLSNYWRSSLVTYVCNICLFYV